MDSSDLSLEDTHFHLSILNFKTPTRRSCVTRGGRDTQQGTLSPNVVPLLVKVVLLRS